MLVGLNLSGWRLLRENVKERVQYVKGQRRYVDVTTVDDPTSDKAEQI